MTNEQIIQGDITNPPTQQKKLDILRIKSTVKDWFKRFYSNKKIFLPISIGLGLIIFTVLIGLIFGNKNGHTAVKVNPSASPSVTDIPQEISNNQTTTDPLTKISKDLKDIKFQLDSLDTQQKKLQPPEIDFDIKY